MKKFVLAIVVIGSFILFSIVYNQANKTSAGLPPMLPASVNAANQPTEVPTSSTVDTGPAASGSDATPTTATKGQYKDGTYTGSVADAQWGNIQVQAVIQNGRITNVIFLQYPNERNRSVMINQYADPQLTSEAIQAQSANVDIITGATDTSEAFIQSLTDALSQAQV